eukprot:5671724-Ditylum_brightwellii.AAC.1
MENNLLYPMQLRMTGIVVNDKSTFLTHKPTENDHCICIPDNGETFRIPLEIKGVTSYFSARKTLQSEFKEVGDEKIRGIYNISQNSLAFKAESYVNHSSQSDAVLTEISPTLIEGNFTKSLRDNVNVKDNIDID